MWRDTAWGMSEENSEIVRRYYVAWNAGGLDAVRAFCSDDIQWEDAPGMPDSGVYRGPDAVAAHFQDLAEVLGT
jgi:ketosteroid isomerase-like protein